MWRRFQFFEKESLPVPPEVAALAAPPKPAAAGSSQVREDGGDSTDGGWVPLAFFLRWK